jgi:Leucine-rich repeat (LRR) protein
MLLLEELWLDGNRLTSIPSFIGNLTNLKHLDLSVNQLTDLTEEIGCCTQLIDLTLSTNDLQVSLKVFLLL